LLTATSSGITVPIAENAERVSKGSSIAAIFSSEAAAENFVEAQALTSKLETYQKINNQLRLAEVDMEKLSAEVDNGFESILDAAYQNDYSNLSEDKLTFCEKLSRRQISLDKKVDCSAQISQLQNQISALTSGGTPSEIIVAEASGYYVSREDGYENIITADDIDSLTADKLKEAFESKKKEPAEGSIGKVIDGYNWYIATIIDSNRVTSFKKGQSVRLILDESTNNFVTTYVYSISGVNEKESMIIFKCNLMNESLAELRKVDGKIVTNDYTGLKVPRDAVRLDENGNSGVYVRRGNIVNFRSLNIIYSEDEFVIASKPSSDSEIQLDYTHLKLYDEVIVSGKELKDGMVIR
jgi:putative membrane fusion protein